MTKAPIAVLGGTFDPVHIGHLAIAEAAWAAFELERIVWIPSGDPGHRSPPAASGMHRLAMLRLALANDPRFAIDEYEIASGMPTYTVPTLIRLRAAWGAVRPIIVLSGADSFASLPTWHRWRELFGLAHFAVVERDGTPLAPEKFDPALAREWRTRLTGPEQLARTSSGCITRVPTARIDASASAIRAALAHGERVDGLLAPDVVAYIGTAGLYH